MNKNLRRLLAELGELLENGGELRQAGYVREALFENDQTFKEFLISNALWGGAGSIADQAFIRQTPAPNPEMDSRRRELERLMIELGQLQVHAGETNRFTKGWIEAFERWRGSKSSSEIAVFDCDGNVQGFGQVEVIEDQEFAPKAKRA